MGDAEDHPFDEGVSPSTLSSHRKSGVSMRSHLLLHPLLLPGLFCLLLVLFSLSTRGITPIDETRYLAVAWEMWLRADFLVPHLNGEAYSHKPPLLFWLIHSGWSLWGVNDWWPRLLPGILSFVGLLLVYRLARLLWPDHTAVAAMAPLLTVTSLLWAVMTTMVMFDMLLTVFALLGLVGIATAWRNRHVLGWSLLGLAIGLGVLAKGPVILLHVLPTGLLAPFWLKGTNQNRGRWYRGISLAVLGGALIALCWAIPAALRGGDVYADAIFWGQTANRMVDSFAHRHPFWWYLPLLPLLLFPWLWWPHIWVGLRDLFRQTDSGIRFVTAWLLPTFIAFSLISGKQPHYLLPLVSGFALLIARGLGQEQTSGERLWLAGMGLVSVAVAGLWFLFTKGAPAESPAPITVSFITLLVIGVVLCFIRPRSSLAGIRTLATVVIVTTGILHLGWVRTTRPAYDLTAVSGAIADYQKGGTALAHVGEYHGQFQFPGRLTRPLEVVPRQQVREWIEQHPSGKLIYYFRHLPREAPPPEIMQRFRSRWVGVWSAESLRTRGSLDTVIRQ